MPSAADPLHRASLRLKHHGVSVTLEVLEGVFAGAGVDAGTRHLLRWLAEERFAEANAVLDLGCGYGPLGLWLAASQPGRRVTAVDRDARALESCELGRAASGLDDHVAVLGSLGYDAVADRTFDLVVSNVPAKIGGTALEHILVDAAHLLAPDGSVAVVVIDRIVEEVRRALDDPAVEIRSVHPTRAYTAFVYGFHGLPATSRAEPGFERGVYRRGHRRFDAAGRSWDAAVAWSIPEFDTLARGTEAAIELVGRRHGELTAVLGVGQGHLPLALRAGGHHGAIRLVDRDLLALRTAAANLGAERGEQVDRRHRSRPDARDLADTELVVAALDEREPVAVTAAVLAPAIAGVAGEVVLHGRSADVRRVLELLPRHGPAWTVVADARRRSHAAVRLRLPHPLRRVAGSS